MPVLRLFAAAREAAGTASVEVPGETVDEVLAAARARFGPELGAVIDASKVWRNGEPATGADPVGAGDEVAVLPPVSGGSGSAGPGRGDRTARPTFAPSDPPPPAKPPAPRRSPSAEAAAARRADATDRPGRPASRARPGTGSDRPTPRRRPAAPGPTGRPPDPTGRPPGPTGRPPGPTGREGTTARRPGPDGQDPRSSAPKGRPRTDGTPPRLTSDGGPVRRSGTASGAARRRRPDGADETPGRRPDPGSARGGAAGPEVGAKPDLIEQRAVRPAPTPTPARLEPGVLTRTTAPMGRPLDPPEGEADTGAEAGTATRLTRMRSVGVPVTGSITVRGKERQVSGRRQRRTELGRRYAPVYDTDGPKVTLGVLWFVAVMGSIALGWWALAFVMAVAAGWAAMETADRWRESGVAVDPWTAALGAAVVAAAGAAGAAYAGGAILLLVLAAVGRMGLTPVGRDHIVTAAGTTVGCAVPFGLASAAVVLTNDLEIGAVVALLLFVFAYDAGDFLIGSGSSNSVEGPITGLVTIAVAAGAIAVLGIPPFEGSPAYVFAAIAAVGCPLGQLAASAILPAADAHAPAVRRLDSLLLLAPIWFVAIDVFMASR